MLVCLCMWLCHGRVSCQYGCCNCMRRKDELVDTYLYFSSLPLTLAVPSYRVRHTEKQTCQIISYCFGDEVQKKKFVQLLPGNSHLWGLCGSKWTLWWLARRAELRNFSLQISQIKELSCSCTLM